MSGQINPLNNFINDVSRTNNTLIIKKNGSYKITKGGSAHCFPFFHRRAKPKQEDLKFTYEVLRGVVELLRGGQLEEGTEKKVLKASNTIFNRIEKEWDKLSEEDRARFYDLPTNLSLSLANDSGLQAREGLDMLNTRIGNAIGMDLDRLFGNDALTIRRTDGSFIETPQELKDFLKDVFDVSDDSAKRLDKAKSFDAFFPNLNEEEKEELSAMRHFLTGVSQSQFLHAGTILKGVLKEENRPKFAFGSNDNVYIQEIDNNKLEVRHYFQLALRSDPEAIFHVNTIAVFDLNDNKWVENKIEFNLKDYENASQELQQKHNFLKELGYNEQL